MIIQDDFCPDPRALKFLSSQHEWEAMIGKFHWWDGWWNAKARNNWEYIIKMLWSSREIELQIAGFEYWCNILDAGEKVNYLGWHRDKDEVLQAETGKVVCPAMATVFYGFPHQVEGGFLEISCEDTLTEVERIAPTFNRLIIFDASKHHRVTKLYQGKRYSLQVNLWQEKPRTFAEGEISISSR